MNRRHERTIRQRWENYVLTIPSEAGAAQRAEVERAFYSGCLSTLSIVSAIAELADAQDVETDALERLLLECRQRLEGLSYAETTKPPEVEG